LQQFIVGRDDDDDDKNKQSQNKQSVTKLANWTVVCVELSRLRTVNCGTLAVCATLRVG
jgi:hypothetical protein